MKSLSSCFFRVLRVLVLPIAVATAPGVAAAPVTLTLVNMSDAEVDNVVVPVDAASVYHALGLAVGTPVRARSLEGKELPCQLETQNGKPSLLLLATMPAHSKLVVSVEPTKEWPLRSLMRALWDKDAMRGELTNGVLMLRTDGKAAELELPDGKRLLEALHFYGWLDEQARHVPSPAVAAQWNLPRLSTNLFQSLEGSASSDTVGSTMQLIKECGGNARGVFVAETFALHPQRPVLGYRLRIENRRDRPVYIADCDGLIHARFGDAMAQQKQLILPTGARLAITGQWLCVGEEQLQPDARTWVILRTDEGRAIGLVNLAPHANNWCFTDAGFWLYQAGRGGERPIKLAPGESVEHGVAFVLFSPGEDAVEGTRASFTALSKGQLAAPLIPPVAAFLDDKPLRGGRVPLLRERFESVDRWMVTGGKLTRAEAGGATLACESREAFAQCALEIDFGKQPILGLEIARLSREGQLKAVARGLAGDAQAVTLLEVRSAGKLEADIAKATGWTGVKQFGLELCLSGGPDALAQLYSVYVGPPPLPAPKLLSPPSDFRLTDIAAFFKWEAVKGAGAYEVQWSNNDKLAKPITARPPMLANVGVWFPENPLPPGPGFWRVRAISDEGVEGKWSERRAVAVNSKHPKLSLRTRIGVDHPLFLLHSITDIERAWRALPEDLRPYCALRVEVDERSLDFFEFCRTAERCGARVVIQCSGPGGGVYTEVYGEGRYGRASLADLEWAFRNCPHVIGAIIVEQFFHHFSDPTSREYAKRLMMLCAKYGRLFVWADGHWGRFGWLELGSDSEMVRHLTEHRGYFVPLWKMNCGHVPLSIHSSVLGYWLCGLCDHFGVEPESWFWYEAGYKRLSESLGLSGGDQSLCPPTMWGQMILLGVASGATVYCLEPCWWLWKENGELTETFQRVVIPLLRGIVRRKLIPPKDAVLANIKLAVKAQKEQLQFAPDFGPLRALYDGTYGLRHDHEMIPNTGRYFFLPILPPACERGPHGIEVVPLAQVGKREDVAKVSEARYPQRYEGDALIVRAGDAIIIMNTHENADVTERYSLPLDGAMERVTGTVGPHHYIVFRRGSPIVGGEPEIENRKSPILDTLWLHANTYPDRTTELSFQYARRPEVGVTPQDALIESHWDEAARMLTLRLSHKQGAVEALVSVR